MRHGVTLELMSTVEVHDKLNYLHQVSAAEGLTYTDITSANRDTILTAYFSTDDNDKGRIVFEDKKIKIDVSLSFDRVVALNTFTKTHYGDEVIDLLQAEDDPDYPPVDEGDDTITA